MILENIKLEKVSTYCINEVIRVINAYSADLIEPTTDNKFKFDLAKNLWKQFHKKIDKQEIPKKHKLKLKVYEAIFLLQIINDVADTEILYTIKESIDRQLK
ncbi:MAG: hypothetical protein COA88_15735 [Kordia sp.]|nr:MAG: hypothetical protein COA88_15735 [Kordia sp.]